MAEKIIGRKEEIKKLQKLLDSDQAELLAIYGRRRVGKTYLISEFFHDKGIYFELTGEFGAPLQKQLDRVPLALQEAFNLEQLPPKPKNWDEVFETLVKLIQKIDVGTKVILYLDELPWLASPKSGLLGSLEHAWNQYFSRMKNVILVLCGSAASWMIKKIVNNRKGLYGRLTDILHLEPFTLEETNLLLEMQGVHLEKKQLVEVYMVTGGIPKYLKHVQRGLSSSQIIQALCFSKGGFLSSEFKGLFHSLFDNSQKHLSIIEALGKYREGLTFKQIIDKTSLNIGGRISEALDELESSGFIYAMPFYGRKSRESQYRLIDEYSLFYLRWIKPFFGSLNKPITDQYWLTQHNSAHFLTWAGYAFENICLRHISEIIDALKIGVVARNVCYWKSDSAQIDLIIERSDKTIHLCEIKFYNDVYTMTQEYAQKMNRRREIFREATGFKGAILNTLITPYGVQSNPAYLSAIDQQIALSDLIPSAQQLCLA